VVSHTGGWACLISFCVNVDAPSLLIHSLPLTIGIFQNDVKVGVSLKQYLITSSRDLAGVWIE
jgi:hypothetical protein